MAVLCASLAVLPVQASSDSRKTTAAQKTTQKKAQKLANKKASEKHAKKSKNSKKSTIVAKNKSNKNKKLAKNRTSTKFANASRNTSKALHSSRPTVSRAVAESRPTYAQMAGLRDQKDALSLKSSVAFVMDQDTKEVLLSKNEHAVLPIASITKLMTGLLVSEAKLPMDEMITITQDDVDTEKGSSSRLRVGTELSRGELLHLALMSSENRAAHALGRTYPGGLNYFVHLMNQKARLFGMYDTRFVEPTGLSSKNQSSARDLATLVNVAYADPLMRELSTSEQHQVDVGNRTLQFRNTNALIKRPDWDIGLQKTGYISEAGQCLVMQAKVAGRKLIIVFLDSAGKLNRIADAERVRQWVEASASNSIRSQPISGTTRM
jgi:D-alanyl-D-alanine endopeptidase (penicillin-binding protein 7)